MDSERYRSTTLPLEKLLEKVGSMYKLVNLAARRAMELSEGAARLVEAKPKEKPSLIALREVMEGRVSYRAKRSTPGADSGQAKL